MGWEGVFGGGEEEWYAVRGQVYRADREGSGDANVSPVSGIREPFVQVVSTFFHVVLYCVCVCVWLFYSLFDVFKYKGKSDHPHLHRI